VLTRPLPTLRRELLLLVLAVATHRQLLCPLLRVGAVRRLPALRLAAGRRTRRGVVGPRLVLRLVRLVLVHDEYCDGRT
jgi:hypothetical protein